MGKAFRESLVSPKAPERDLWQGFGGTGNLKFFSKRYNVPHSEHFDFGL